MLILFIVRATLSIQFLVLKIVIVKITNYPHKGWDALRGATWHCEDPAYSGRLSKFHTGQVEHMSGPLYP